MKITQVISDENVGGAGILLSLITEGLKNEFDFEVIVPKGSALIKRLPEGITVTPIPMKGGKALSEALTFYQYFKKHPCDVLHTHAAFGARLGGALAGIPRLYSTRHCAMGTHGVPPLYSALYDRITTLTVATAAAAEEELIGEGVKKEKIRRIYNGTKEPIRLCAAEKKEMLRSLSLEESDTVLGCVGRLERVKGQDILLRALALLSKKYPSLHLILVGDGRQRGALEALSSSLGIRDRVRFVGYTDRPYLYQNLFTLNVNPSRGNETSCLATSECMSLGIPTVASDFGGNREMIFPYKNGLLFECDNFFSLEYALSKLLADTTLYECLSSGALRYYRDLFSLDRMANQYRAVYNSFRK